jgi:hypothetical protein
VSSSKLETMSAVSVGFVSSIAARKIVGAGAVPQAELEDDKPSVQIQLHPPRRGASRMRHRFALSR